jgi:hypothetical protein
MTRLSRLRRFSLTGVCAVTIGVGGVLCPATAFALPMEDCPDAGEPCGWGHAPPPPFGAGPVLPEPRDLEPLPAEPPPAPPPPTTIPLPEGPVTMFPQFPY